MRNKNKLEYNLSMKQAARDIMKMNDTVTKTKHHLMIKEEDSDQVILWQKQLLAEMKLYITYLGLIDALIVTEKEKIKRNQGSLRINLDQEPTEKIYIYLEQRKNLLRMIERETSIKQLSFINDILNSIPAFNQFQLFYQDIYYHHYELKLQLQFMNTYHYGFMQEKYVNYENITEQFERYCEEIQIHKSKKQKQLQKRKNPSKE